MLLLGGRGVAEEGGGGDVNLGAYRTGLLGMGFQDDVMHQMTRAMPVQAFWAVFWHHAANRMVYGVMPR